MNAETLRKLLTGQPGQPFQPFAISMTNGEIHQIRHPEMAWVVGGKIYIHLPEKNCEVVCSLLHINSVHPVELVKS